MPAFIHTKAEEHKWNAIKHSVAKQRGKSVEDFSDRDWATVNAAWHKSEGNMAKFEEIMKSLTSVAKIKVPNAGKMPKPKSMPKPGDKPSLFFKSEDIKHPTLCKLRDFIEKKRNQP